MAKCLGRVAAPVRASPRYVRRYGRLSQQRSAIESLMHAPRPPGQCARLSCSSKAMFDRAYVAFCPERGVLVSVACRPVTGQRPSCRVRHFAMHADKGDENENYTGVVSTSIVRQLMSLGGFLPCDFGSSVGTISQGIHRFLPPLAGPNSAVPKVHILHSCLKSTMRWSVDSMPRNSSFSDPSSVHL